jgi:hypothetical protein
MSHDFGEIAIDVHLIRAFDDTEALRIVITSHVSGARVEMTMPRVGMYSDANMPIERSTVEDVAREVAHLLAMLH